MRCRPISASSSPPAPGLRTRGFSSSGANGASVMAHYESPDGPLRLRIRPRLRGDMLGMALPGADGVARNWPSTKPPAAPIYGRAEGRPARHCSEGRSIWGNAPRPNGMMLFRRFRSRTAAEIQGMWYRMIGLWEVVVSASGPEAKQAEVEAAGAAAMTNPVAGRAGQRRASRHSPRLAADAARLPVQSRPRRQWPPVQPGPIVAAMIGMGLSSYFMDNPAALPHPVNQPNAYCRIETFRVGQTEITALGWTGDVSAYPAARYAFLIGGSATMFQYESFFTVPPAQATGAA